MNKLTTKDVIKSLGLISIEYKKVIPDDNKEGNAIFWGIKVMKQAKQYIKQRDMAISLLKELAFVNIDDSIEDRKKSAADVQAFLRHIGLGKWLDLVIKENSKR
jgi:hypothetical protein